MQDKYCLCKTHQTNVLHNEMHKLMLWWIYVSINFCFSSTPTYLQGLF